jgi:hypothetical protein
VTYADRRPVNYPRHQVPITYTFTCTAFTSLSHISLFSKTVFGASLAWRLHSFPCRPARFDHERATEAIVSRSVTLYVLPQMFQHRQRRQLRSIRAQLPVLIP